MQTFCLHPSLKLFNEICECGKLRLKEGDDFEAWRLACLWKYSGEWECDSNDGILDLERKLSEKISKNPSKAAALQILHMFFATGDLDYIELFYECMGHELLPESTRRYLVETYKMVKKLYQEKCWDVTNEQMEKLGLRRDVVDFSYFDNAKERAIEEKNGRVDLTIKK